VDPFLQVSPPKPCVYFPSPPPKCHMSRTYHSSLFHHRNHIWRVVQIMNLLIKQFPPVPAPPSLSYKYLPRHPVREFTSLCSSSSVKYQVSHKYERTGEITFFLNFNLRVFCVKQGRERFKLCHFQSVA
jgi:hypothetical protein